MVDAGLNFSLLFGAETSEKGRESTVISAFVLVICQGSRQFMLGLCVWLKKKKNVTDMKWETNN